MTLRELRESKHLTQDEVVERAKSLQKSINQATVSALEIGRSRDPRNSTLQTLAEVYQVPYQSVVDALNETIRESEAA